MYEEFYGLTDEPFSITPNPKFLYLSKKHEGGLEHLLYGIERKRGLIVLTGDIGTGKTTLLNTIAQRIDEKTHIAFLVHSQISPLDIYKYIFHEFGINVEVHGKSEGDLLIILGDFLVQCANNGENCVLIVDEAQSLSQDVLEQIRLLLNFETYERKLLQIILVGHPHLHEKLNLLESAKLKQRVSISYNLLPLDYAETKGYIETRLLVAGATRPIYDNEAIAEIYHCAQGIPRLINIVCDLALFLGYAKKQVVLGRDMILEAQQMLQMQEAHTPRTLSLEQVREPGVQLPHRHPALVDDPLQGVLSPQGGRPSQDVLAPLPWLMDHTDSPASAQTPARGRGFRWLAFGGIVASLALGLILWGGILQEPASRPPGLDERRPSGAPRVSAVPAGLPGAASSFTSTERPGSQPSEAIPPAAVPVTAAVPPATAARPGGPQGSPAEPTPSEDSLGLPKQGRGASLRLSSLPEAAAPGEAGATPGSPLTPRVVVVQEGDTLGAIILRAYKRFDSRILTLVQGANPNLTNPSRIVIGQQIVLPNLPQ